MRTSLFIVLIGIANQLVAYHVNVGITEKKSNMYIHYIKMDSSDTVLNLKRRLGCEDLIFFNDSEYLDHATMKDIIEEESSSSEYYKWQKKNKIDIVVRIDKNPHKSCCTKLIHMMTHCFRIYCTLPYHKYCL